MRRRRGWKKGDWLVRDEESGFVEYGTNVSTDYFGDLKRKDQYEGPHPQLFVKALQDPYIKYPQADPSYVYNTSAYNVSAFVYGTNIPTPFGPASHLFQSAAVIPGDPGIGDMAIGSDFIIR